MLNKENFIEEDEIDLGKLFKIIGKRRIFIVLFTFIIALCFISYVFITKPTPVYQGKVLIEIGEIQSENFQPQAIANPTNLSKILMTKLSVNAFSPKGTDRLLQLSSNNIDKDVIKENLKKAVEFVIQRHKEKVIFFKNFIITKQIGEIVVSNEPINKQKKRQIIIVSFFTAFILSILIVFIMEFIKGFKENE